MLITVSVNLLILVLLLLILKQLADASLVLVDMPRRLVLLQCSSPWIRFGFGIQLSLFAIDLHHLLAVLVRRAQHSLFLLVLV